MINSDSLFIDKGNYSLHIKRLYENKDGVAILLLHGSIEDGRIFYSKSGKGLAPFLAANGYDVYVPDLRGKGKSTPPITSASTFGQQEAIDEDMPDIMNFIQQENGHAPAYIMAHSWGGVILLSYLAKHECKALKGIVLFGAKRDVRVQNFKRWLNIDLLWNFLGNYLVKKYGYLPAVKYKVGSADESKNFYLQVNHWVYSKGWIDQFDGFDYALALQNKQLPPLLSITGVKDTHSGHPKDVKRLVEEIGNQPNHIFKIIGKSSGYKEDYNHVNLLTHPKATSDHFLEVLAWIKDKK